MVVPCRTVSAPRRGVWFPSLRFLPPALALFSHLVVAGLTISVARAQGHAAPPPSAVWSSGLDGGVASALDAAAPLASTPVDASAAMPVPIATGLESSVSSSDAVTTPLAPEPSAPTPTMDISGGDISGGPAPVDVTVRGEGRARLANSAEAVKVVDLARARTESSDLGEVLARTQGVSVRRTGGLGSDVRFSLNGLSDDQIRFFLDGAPLDLMGYTAGFANVPVNLVSRVEIYSGVVPIRFGADALGGAVNLVSDEHLDRTVAGVSYQVGSFGLHRLNGAANYAHSPSGLFARVDGYLDRAKNDYWVDDVNVVSAEGQIEKIRTRRRHDVYQAAGVGLEVGVLDKSWAKRLSLRGFYSSYDKELQNDLLMLIPYGAATFGRSTTGATLRYENDFGHGVSLTSVAGYSFTGSRLLDTAECVYDWLGKCGRKRRYPGELSDYEGDNGGDIRIDRHATFGRFNLSYAPVRDHKLNLSTAPTFYRQTGKNERLVDPTIRDPFNADRSLVSLVTGLEYQLEKFDKRLQVIAFGKHYFQWVDVAAGGGMRWEKVEEQTLKTRALGAGAEARHRFTPWLMAKASYEWATRLPRLEELLGDTLLIVGNLELEPERSHNANLGLESQLKRTRAGSFRFGATGFWRDIHDMIVLFAQPKTQNYQNLLDARSTGVELNASWVAPREYGGISGNFTSQKFVSTADSGPFAAFEGKRLPHRPSLFANVEARLDFRALISASDKISLIERTNWIGQFDRGWGDTGMAEGKAKVDAQLLHSLVLSYLYAIDYGEAVISLEAHNLSDARVYDFYGLQKPGRAFYAKISVNYN